MKIYPVQHIIILELAQGNIKPLVYKEDIYRGQEEDKWDIQKIISYKAIDKQIWYKVKQTGYKETTWEPKDNLKNVMKKVKEYYRKLDQVKERKKD